MGGDDNMTTSKKSAKDLAFDKERAKYRQQIKELESQIKRKDEYIKKMDILLSNKEKELTEKCDWINRLLEYTELSEEEMKKVIEKDKTVSEITESFSSMQRVLSSFGLGSFI